MKATGITRKVDELGRIVLPIELRKMLGIKEKDALEIYIGDNKEIILKAYAPRCTFCDSMDDLAEINGKHICRKCLVEAENKLKW